MGRSTYHLLTEAEPFSEIDGGAISRWAANVLRDTSGSVVVCPSADDSWRFPPESIRVITRMSFYKLLRKHRKQLPWGFHCRAIRYIFASLIARIEPGDVVWIHNRPEFAVALTDGIRRAGGHVVLQLHNAHLVEGPEPLMRQVGVDQLVFVSRFLEDQARQKFPSLGPSTVVYSGADQSIFYPAIDKRTNPANTTVLFAGRLVEDKGVHILLEAMRLLEKQQVRLQAQVVGSASFGAVEETDYIRRLKATSPATVKFFAYRSGAALGDLFRDADIFCSPAVWDEPFGLVNVEALASALPVVTTCGGGAREILSSGGGILVERGSADRLAEALRQLVEDPELRTRIGRQGYAAFLKRFTWSNARTQVADIQSALIT